MTGQMLSKARDGGELDVFTGTDPAAVAKAFKASGMFPDLASEAQAFVKIIAGRELGIGPMAAISGLNVIKGKATPSANLLATLVKAHPVYDYIVREVTAECARIEFYQHGKSLGVSEFTGEDAKRAGLTGQNWQKYPKAMLFARALSQGVRWFCPDVTAGSAAYVPEELGATVDAEGDVVDAPVVEQSAPEPVETRPERLGRLLAEHEVSGSELSTVRDWIATDEGKADPARTEEAIELLENGDRDGLLDLVEVPF